MVPLNKFDLSLNLALPDLFDEGLYTVVSSDSFQDTLINDISPSFNLPEDQYNIMVYSENLYPEHFNILLDSDKDTKIVALEPASAPYYSKNQSDGDHHVEGIGLGFALPLLDKNNYHEARGIDESEAREMAKLLASEEGIFGGTSSGLNVVGAIQLAVELGKGKTVVTIAVDTGLKYLTGNLFL